MVTSVSPSITASPLFTLMPVMVPEVSASMLFCIFMASRITTVSPALTLSPTFTLISLMVPGRGATTGLPAAAAAAGWVVGAVLAFVAEEELLDSSLFVLHLTSLSVCQPLLAASFLPQMGCHLRLHWRCCLLYPGSRLRNRLLSLYIDTSYPLNFTLFVFHLTLLNFGAFHLVCLGLMVMMPDSTSCTSSRYSLRASEMTAM